MAWFDRSSGGKKGHPEGPTHLGLNPGAPVEKEPSESPEEKVVGYLYKESRVTGQLTFHGPANIEGSVEGEILCDGVLTIGEEADVRAKISGKVVIVRGRVEGDVVAKEKVKLEHPAQLFGNVVTPRLIITEGVVFDGNCSMGQVGEKGEVQSLLKSSSDKGFKSEAAKPTIDLKK